MPGRKTGVGQEKDMYKLNLWEGDKIFLQLLEDRQPFFSLKLTYEGDRLIEAVLDGRKLLQSQFSQNETGR